MPQPCIQQTAFKVHQLYCGCDENRSFPQAVSQDVNAGFHTEQGVAEDGVAQIFLSRQFRCSKTRRRAYVQGEQQNYHAILLSVFVLAFFLILEWAGPLSTLSAFTPIQPQQPTATPHFTHEQRHMFGTLGPGVSNDMVFVYKSPP